MDVRPCTIINGPSASRVVPTQKGEKVAQRKMRLTQLTSTDCEMGLTVPTASEWATGDSYSFIKCLLNANYMSNVTLTLRSFRLTIRTVLTNT